MKNTKTYWIGVITLGILATGAFFLTNKPLKTEVEMQKETAFMPEETKEIMMSEGETRSRYVEYTQESFGQAASGRRVLFFYASWCPTCRPADTNITENADKIPEDTTVIRVNYNDSETDQAENDLAKKYSVTYQHTFIQIDEQGSEITKWNGGQIDELLKNIKTAK